MINRYSGKLRSFGRRRVGFDSYLANVQTAKCTSCPNYDEARKDFNGRLRSEVRGFIG